MRFIPFNVWGFQKNLLSDFQTYPLLMLLKARQLGITQTILGYCNWLASFHDAVNILLLSKTETDAQDLLVKINVMRDSLPFWLKMETTVNNTTTLRFKDTMSEIVALPATKAAGRSKTATLVVCDEWAYHPYAEENYLAYKPTIDAGGRLIGISTANGLGGFYHDMWEAALKGVNGFHPLFLPWNLHPDRTPEWYAATKKQYSATERQRAEFYQEYPSCVTGDTLVSTNPSGIVPIQDVIPSSKIKKLHRNGVVETLRIETGDGRILTSTGKHHIHLPDGTFKQVSQLVPGDTISLQPPTFAAQPYIVRWSSVPMWHNAVPIDEDLARLLGIFLGDGNYYCGTLSVACYKDDDVIQEVVRLITKYLGTAPTVRETGKKQGNSWEVRIGCKYIAKALEEMGVINRYSDGSLKRNVAVPPCILQSPRPVVREFLRGLFEADGFIGYKTPRMVLFSKYENFLRQIQLLLLGFGITSRIRVADKINGDGRKFVGRELSLRANEVDLFMQEIGFISSRKNDRFKNFPTQSWNRLPITYSDTVKAITDNGLAEVFDLTVEPEHVYSANGILVHNSPDEAFVANVSGVFDREVLDRLAKDCKPPIAIEGNLKIWQLPDPTKTYLIGCDPGEGVGQNFSGAAVIDWQTGIHVADLHGQIEPDTLARELSELGKRYNYAVLGVERNNHGHTVLNVLNNYLGYPNIYKEHDIDTLSVKGDKRLGLLTTAQSKENMIQDFKSALYRNQFITYDQEAIRELRTYSQYKDEASGRVKYGAAPKCFDDRVMKLMIAWQMRHHAVRNNMHTKVKLTVLGGV